MQMPKKCARCHYASINYKLLNIISKQEQNITVYKYVCCCKCGHEKPKQSYEELNFNFDDKIPEEISKTLPDNYINKIKHKHNFININTEYFDKKFDDNDNCVEFKEKNLFECSICEKRYKETKAFNYNKDNSDKFISFTQERKNEKETKRLIDLHNTSNICPITGKEYHKIDKGFINDRPFLSVDVYDIHCSECDLQLEYRREEINFGKY